MLVPRHVAFAPLPVRLQGLGVEFRQAGETYLWHGLRRGRERGSIFQYTLEGEGSLEREGRKTRLLPGMAMLLPIPDDHAYGVMPGGVGWRFFFLTLGGDALDAHYRALVHRCGGVSRLAPDAAPLVCALHLLERGRAMTLNNPFECSDLAWRFVMALSRELSNPSPQASGRPDWLNQILESLEGRFDPSLTVSTLANRVGLSREHLTRVWQAHVGLSPARYLLAWRLRQAAAQLQESRRSIAEISAACGFSHPAVLTRAFRRLYACSPVDWRKRMAGK